MATNSIQYIYEAIDRFSAVADKINSKIATNQKAMERLSKVSSKMTSIGKDLSMKVTLPVVAMGTASLYAFAQYEKGLVKTGTLLGKTGFKEHKKLMEEVIKTTISQGFAIEETTEAYFNSLSATSDINMANKIMKEASILAIAGQIDLGLAAKATTSIMNAYRLSLDDVRKVTNAFSVADDIGVTNIGELADNVGKVATVAKTAGVNFDELLITLATLTKGGLSTDEATTALRTTLTALSSPAKGTIKIFSQLEKKLGKELPKNITQLRKIGLAESLLRLGDAVKLDADKFAQAIPEVRAFVGITSLQKQSVEEINKAILKVSEVQKNGTGVLEKYGMMYNTTSEKFKRFKGNFNIKRIEWGERLAPTFERVLNFLDKIITKFSKLSTSSQNFILLAVVIGALLPPLLVVLGSIGTLIATIGAIPTAIIGAFTISIPFIVLAYGWIKNLVKITKEWINGFSKVNSIKEFFSYIWETIKKIGGWIDKTFLGNMFSKIALSQQQTVISQVNTPKQSYASWSPMNFNNQSSASIDINIKAPKGTVEKTETKKKGYSLKLGTNFSEAY